MLAFLFLLAGGLYLLPGIVAQSRKVRNTGSIWVINIFLGWTVIGWIVALAMAGRSANPVSFQQVSPPAQPPFRPEPPSKRQENPDRAYGADGE
jgi:hypothetical protein